MSDYLHACTDCGTPTIRWRGSVHGFTCDPCMHRRLGLDKSAVTVYSTETATTNHPATPRESMPR